MREVFVTDTIEITQTWPRLRVVSIASLLADTIRRITSQPGDEGGRDPSKN